MQVAHVEDTITHVVLGQQETMDMGVSDSAEFFQILSSTLYTDQKLAVVRETLCNAWDAHIDAGKINVPIELTVSESEFIIRDYGLGIPHHLIQPIYGVYGNSTKKNDGKATGGFGLGCKAPFAYTDHFQVTSHHEGKMSIYAMSKSSGETMGKPGITPIVHGIPSLDTGIEVKIPIKMGDRHNFLSLCKKIVRQGEINAKINGDLFDDLIELSKAKYGYVITSLIKEASSRIYVRYGNVIYPIHQHTQYKEEYESAYRSLSSVDPNKGGYNEDARYTLILMAEPNTIAVTPSRESLSNQDHTLKNLKILLNKFNQTFNKKFVSHFPKKILEGVQKKIEAKEILDFLKIDGLTNLVSETTIESAYNFTQCAELAMLGRKFNHTKRSLKLAVRSLAEAEIIDKGLAHSWLSHHQKDSAKEVKMIPSTGWGHTNKLVYNWPMRHMIGPLIQKMQLTNTLNSSELGLIDNAVVHDRYANNRKHLAYGHHYAIKVVYDDHEKTLKLLRKHVILSRTRKDIMDYSDYSRVGTLPGSGNGTFFYIVGAKEESYQEALALFTKEGYKIHDLVPEQLEELQIQREHRERIRKYRLGLDADETLPEIKKGKRGVVLANACIDDSTISNEFKERMTGAPRILEPEFVFQVQAIDGCTIHSFRGSDYFIHKMGSKGGISSTSKQYGNYLEKGAMPFLDYYIHWVADEIISNPRIHKALSISLGHVQRNANNDMFAWIWSLRIYESDYLCVHFGIHVELTKEDKKFLNMWNEIKRRAGDHDHVIEVTRRLSQIKPDPKNQEIYETVRKSKGLVYLDHKVLDHIETRPEAKELFFMALNN